MNAKIIDKHIDYEFLQKGYFFLSPSDNCGYYIIQVEEIDKGISCKVKVLKTEMPQEDGEEIKCENGEYIAINEVEDYFTIEIWYKYYFPKFSHYQWYHEDSKYPSNQMRGFYEVMQFAYDLGVRMAEITPI